MDGFDKAVIDRLPLAESVMVLFRTIADEATLSEIWEDHRGRCYEKELCFPVMVHLISDALLTGESGRQSFRKSQEQGVLKTSLQAAYEKLARLPVAVSEAFLQRSTATLRKVFPDWSTWEQPESLRRFGIVVYDGKAIKRVAHRLKATRGTRGGLLGGRALVAQDWRTGMALTMCCDPDGEANEVKYVGELVPKVRELVAEPILHVGDRGFCDLVRFRLFRASAEDHFLVRHHSKVKFHRDPSMTERQSLTKAGETVTESWGWLGSEKDRRRIYVRRIELLRRDGESVVLITTLLDADAYPAEDLLFVYRNRWGIEQMFQQVTEVFGLSHLIGTTPKAALFQLAFCLLLYNLIQVVRGYVAQAKKCEPTDVSAELLFRDVEEELIAWNKFLTPQQTQDYLDVVPTIPKLKQRLTQLLRNHWSETWRASPPQSVHNSTPSKRQKTHASVHRLLFGPPPKKQRKNLTERIIKNAHEPRPSRP